ncbi:MAG: DUF4845 domain-containing protein [Pseudomonadota bacterium]
MMSLAKQRGMTLIGMMFMASIFGLLIVAGLRILPLYIDGQKMESIFKALEKNGDGSMGRQEVVRFIQNRMDINQMEYQHFDLSSIKIDASSGGGKRVTLQYELRAPIMGNLDAVASFSHTATVR